MSHQPWWWRSKCRPLGVTMPNSDCNGANETDDWVVCVRPGLRRRWTSRRWDLAKSQLEADQAFGPAASPATDAFTGQHFEGDRALGRFLNPKAKTKSEWRGD